MSSSTAFHGSHSLAVNFNGNGSTKYSLWLTVNLCGSSSSAVANFSGRSFAFRVRFQGNGGAQLLPAQVQGSIYWGGSPGFEPGFHDIVYAGSGSWEDYSVRLDDVDANASNNITFQIGVAPMWSGTIYFDQMEIL